MQNLYLVLFVLLHSRCEPYIVYSVLDIRFYNNNVFFRCIVIFIKNSYFISYFTGTVDE